MPKFVLNKTGRTQLIGVAGKRRAGPLLDEFDDGDAWLERVVLRIERGEVIGGERAAYGARVDVQADLAKARVEAAEREKERRRESEWRATLVANEIYHRRRTDPKHTSSRIRFLFAQLRSFCPDCDISLKNTDPSRGCKRHRYIGDPP